MIMSLWKFRDILKLAFHSRAKVQVASSKKVTYKETI